MKEPVLLNKDGNVTIRVFKNIITFVIDLLIAQGDPSATM